MRSEKAIEGGTRRLAGDDGIVGSCGKTIGRKIGWMRFTLLAMLLRRVDSRQKDTEGLKDSLIYFGT